MIKTTIFTFLAFVLFTIESKSFAQSKPNNIQNNKYYTILNYEIKYSKGNKIDWGGAYDLANKSIVNNTEEWRLPTIEELREIYFYRKSFGADEGIFWSSTIGFPLRMGLIYCIDFKKGDESLYNGGKHDFLLLRNKKY
jgi:hypothetical protein